MTIKFYNSLTNQKEDFVPIREGEVGMYVCGMTVYDNCHLGHARAMMAFDVLVRYLRYQDYKVNFIRNITDIDDRIIDEVVKGGITYVLMHMRGLPETMQNNVIYENVIDKIQRFFKTELKSLID